jgi:hypothetical protein
MDGTRDHYVKWVKLCSKILHVFTLSEI